MQADRIIFRQINGHLAIKVHPAIGGVGNAQLDFRLIANQNRAVGQGMRTQGNERNSGNLRVQDRAIGRQCIGRGTRGCGNDQPVGTQVVDEFAVDEQFELDHATDGPLVDHDIVQGQIGGQLLAIAHDFGVEQHTGLGNKAAVEQVFPLVQLLPPAAKSELPVVTLPAVPDPKVTEVAAKVAEMAKKVEEVAKQVGEVPGKVEEAARKAEEAARKAAEEKKAAEKKAEEEAKAKELAEKAKLAVKSIEMEEQRTRELIAQNTARRKKQAAVIGALAVVLVAGVFVFLRRQRAAEAAAVFARLQLLDGDGTEHLMRKTALRIGRGQDNDLTLANDSVSRHHAEIFRTRDGVFTITELNAGNGVLVNGKAVRKAELHHEDVIERGEVRIRFLIS